MPLNRDGALIGEFRGTVTSPDLQFMIDEIIIEGNTSAFWYTWQDTHKGEFMGIAPTGKRVMGLGCIVGHWVNGKIVEEWLYGNWLGFFQQLGVVPLLD